MEIISNRAADRLFNQETAAPSAVAEAINIQTEIPKESLERFFWGEAGALTEAERKILAQTFQFQFDLFELAAKFSTQSTSKEVIIYLLEKITEDYLEPIECQGCAQLESAVLDSDLNIYGDYYLYHLAIDMLEHIVDVGVPNRIHSESSFSNDFSQETLNDLIEADTNSLSPAMSAAFERLPTNQQIEVLALVYKKLSHSKEDSEDLLEIETLVLFRNRYLSKLAKRVFDALAAGPAVGLSSSDLVLRLNLNNKRSLGQLERSVNHAVDRLNEENIDKDFINPLKTFRKGNEKHYLLDSTTLEDWRVLLRAEEKIIAGS
jgi:hypothetical protein